MPRVIHFEIHADNPDRAIAFYHTVFGWEFKKWAGPMDYWLITTGPEGKPGINGGLLKRPGPIPGEGQGVNAFVCTLEVPSVDDDMAKIASSGAVVVMPKMAVPGVGWLAYAKDTEGNIFGIMQEDRSAK